MYSRLLPLVFVASGLEYSEEVGKQARRQGRDPALGLRGLGGSRRVTYRTDDDLSIELDSHQLPSEASRS